MNQQVVDTIENGLRAMCGTATAYQRLVDAGPLSHIVINDFKARLRGLPKKDWPSAIEMQARNRAHEILSFYLPGDLYHTPKEFVWTMISMEFYKAFRPLFASSRPTWSRMALAKNTFLAEAEIIYTRALGTEDQRAAMTRREVAALERTPTFYDKLWQSAGRGEAWALTEIIDDWINGRESDGLDPSNFLLMVRAAVNRREDWHQVEGEEDAEAFQPMAHSPIRTHRALLEWYLSSHNAEALGVYSCLDDAN